MIAATDDGILMDTNRSWSIDDKRLNFQFGCEIGWEIKNGKRGRMLRNPTYTGIGPSFWGSLDMLGNESERTFWGTPNCGKGQPGQIGHTGPPGRAMPLPRRASGGARMNDRLLSTCRAGAQPRREPRQRPRSPSPQGTEALTRFATSFIHQNVADAAREVHLRVALDGRVAEATDNRTDDDALARLVRSTLEAARLQPVDPGWPGLAPVAEAPKVDHWDDGTASAAPDERAERIASFVHAADGLETAGFCSTEGLETVFANSAGQRASGRSDAGSGRRDRAHRQLGRSRSGRIGPALGPRWRSRRRARDEARP